MKYIAALALFLAATAALAQDAAPLNWLDDLDKACEQAAKDKKLVLLRQIVCDCTEKSCAYADIAARPWYLEDRAARTLVSEHFVPVAVHVPPAKADEGLTDAGFPEVKLRRGLRTLFLTPARTVIHRLDLCPYASDVKSEIAFALKVGQECFEPDGTPVAGGKRKLVSLHTEHELKPGTWHEKGGSPAPDCGCRPPENPNSASHRMWSGYRRGVLWHTDLEEAKALAAKSKRLVFYYQIVGELNKEGC